MSKTRDSTLKPHLHPECYATRIALDPRLSVQPARVPFGSTWVDAIVALSVAGTYQLNVQSRPESSGVRTPDGTALTVGP